DSADPSPRPSPLLKGRGRIAGRSDARGSSGTGTALARGFIEPMKARLVDSPPSGEWNYEIKFDGFRALGIKNGDHVRLFSRNEKDMGGKFPEVVASLEKLEA